MNDANAKNRCMANGHRRNRNSCVCVFGIGSLGGRKVARRSFMSHAQTHRPWCMCGVRGSIEIRKTLTLTIYRKILTFFLFIVKHHITRTYVPQMEKKIIRHARAKGLVFAATLGWALNVVAGGAAQSLESGPGDALWILNMLLTPDKCLCLSHTHSLATWRKKKNVFFKQK